LPEAATSRPGQSGRLRRVLTRRDLILYGLVILTPTAPYPVFGIIQQESRGHATLTYLVAMVAMLFTAMSYGKMAAAFPSAGSTYTYAQRSLNEYVGFLAGWGMILDYFLIPLLSVIYASLTAQRLLPSVPYVVWVILFTTGMTAVNIRGIKVTARASSILMAVMTVIAILFIGVAARWVAAHAGLGGLFQLQGIYRPETFALRPLMLGAAIATLSYIGFDAISTLAEDTVDPEHTIGSATVICCILQTVICVVTVYLATLVWPDYRTLPNAETAILDVGGRIGGAWLLGLISLVLLVAGVASALTGQAGASRLLLGMGRDGVLSKKLFAYVHPKYATPTRSIYLMGAFAMLGGIFMHFQMAVELLNFGAFVGFILVNLSVIRHYFLRLGRRSGMDVVRHLIAPLLGAIVCAYVWMSLSNNAKLVGFLWLAIGLLYLGILTRGFKIHPKPFTFEQEA